LTRVLFRRGFLKHIGPSSRARPLCRYPRPKSRPLANFKYIHSGVVFPAFSRSVVVLLRWCQQVAGHLLRCRYLEIRRDPFTPCPAPRSFSPRRFLSPSLSSAGLAGLCPSPHPHEILFRPAPASFLRGRVFFVPRKGL